MAKHLHSHKNLTKNQSLVMAQLSKSKGPLSAYALLDNLREHGLKAPLQVYRALDKLVEFGMAHRIESLNAFIACTHKGCETEETVSFMICEDCGDVSEISDSKLKQRVLDLSKDKKFTLESTTIELRGWCSECRDK